MTLAVARPSAPAAPAKLTDAHAAVLAWYATNARELAFRQTVDPWAVLVSEVMAQQTQAARAADHWERFMAAYPTPAALADASPADAIRAWRGLGYNRRALALRAAAGRIVEVHGGRVPDDLEALVALPGIGPYTARAVLALAFGHPVAALDTNIRRVVGRAFDDAERSGRELQSFADGLVPTRRAAAWTHALMDVGATFCRPRDPRCDACPLAAACIARGALRDTEAGRGARHRPARQTPRFESTTRWLRGRILDRLRDAPDGAWVRFSEPLGSHDVAAVHAQLRRLAREGLLQMDERAPGRSSRDRARLVAAS